MIKNARRILGSKDEEDIVRSVQSEPRCRVGFEIGKSPLSIRSAAHSSRERDTDK
jgi:hypothetical protein